MRNIKSILILFVAIAGFSACKKTEYSFGELKTPGDLTLTTAVAGVSASAPNGDGSGEVAISVQSSNTITYKIDFGDGTTKMVPSGVINYKYSLPDTNTYTITVSAIGSGGIISTLSKKVRVFVAFNIPSDIVTFLTNDASKVWVSASDIAGHVGVGPTNTFTPDWYAATPNSRDACLYDDEITFSKDAAGNVIMSVDNKGETFIIAGARPYYGLSAGADGCVEIDASGAKQLTFSNASSGSTTDNSTTIQFTVPGNGILNFATGANTYEILSISATQLSLRNIGADGNAWYQILKAK